MDDKKHEAIQNLVQKINTMLQSQTFVDVSYEFK
jgi:hypothetical protein